MFDLIKHSSIYCKMDCKVLMGGCCVFRDWLLEHTELYVDSYITIQSLASSFMLKSGCYENVFQISGVLQQSISRSVVGGRVMTNSNKIYHVTNITADFDSCSLYQSAIYFMCVSFLEGFSNVLTNLSYDFFKQSRWTFYDN